MREKQRFLVYRWKRLAKLSAGELEALLVKEIARVHGDFGVALLGPRFKVFSVADQGVVIKARIEAQTLLRDVVKEFNSMQLIHIAGSASLALKAVEKKMKSVQGKDLGMW